MTERDTTSSQEGSVKDKRSKECRVITEDQ